MSSYALLDFTESLDIVTQSVTWRREGPSLDVLPSRVVAAWGTVPDREGGTLGDWSGGFVMELVDGTFAYLEGWCDYSGWGCQDGAEVKRQAEPFDLEALKADVAARFHYDDVGWDMEPADLNRWLDAAMPRDEWGSPRAV